MSVIRCLSRPPCLMLAAALFAAPALADEVRRLAVPMLPAYKQECAACHVAYPPGLLPAPSWQRLLAHLPQHFGSDASLDPATVKQLSEWLTANAAPAGRAVEAPPQDRITRSTWFVREHREVPAQAWQRPSIRSAANCAACHTQANEGVFDEHDVRIPR
jgi:hypothetical protein